MSLTWVLAVHNEALYLKYSLRDIPKSVDHVVAVLDRCTDNSAKIISSQHFNSTFCIVNKSWAEWTNTCAEAKNLGVDLADGDLILQADADMVLDEFALWVAKDFLNGRFGTYTPPFDVCVINYRQYSLFGSWRDRMKDEAANLFAHVTRLLGIHPNRGGLYVARRRVAHLDDVPSEYDFLQQKARVWTINSKTLHLRPRWDKQSQLSRGRARARLPQYPFWKILLSSIMQFQPYMFVGFIQAKKGLKFESTVGC